MLGAIVKVSVVAVTVKLTVVVTFDELEGVTVTVVGPEAAMFGAVLIVNSVVAFVEPSNATLEGLKLQVAPDGKPEQLLELKFTIVAVEPLTGAMVNVVVVD